MAMDPEIAKLAVELQLADIDELLDSLYSTEELPEGNKRTSFKFMRHDLQDQLQVLEGQILTLRILREEHENRLTFTRLLEEERQAVNDHQLALRLAGTNGPGPEAAIAEVPVLADIDGDEDEQWELAKALYAAAFGVNLLDPVPAIVDGGVSPSEGSSSTKAHNAGSEALVKCCVCMEDVFSKSVVTLACKPEAHTYCRADLIKLFTNAIQNTTHFPLQCCKTPIPLDVCRAFLPRDLLKTFDMKVEELTTPNPTYCSNNKCAEFIRPNSIKAGIGRCPFCSANTCTLCKGEEHEGLCPYDPHVHLLMDIAERSKWQQCPRCHELVELSSGCFHIRCRCTNEFCYLCGKQWKTCTCPQADENYLTRPAPGRENNSLQPASKRPRRR